MGNRAETMAQPSAAAKRTEKELKSVSTKCPFVQVTRGEQLQWTVIFSGPADSAYEGCGIPMDIQFPSDYPFKPPAVLFRQQTMWHPRVEFETGGLCLNLLKEQYSPAVQMPQIFDAIQSMLVAPQSDAPLNQQAQAQYDTDPEAFATKVQNLHGRSKSGFAASFAARTKGGASSAPTRGAASGAAGGSQSAAPNSTERACCGWF